jgi:DNA gyrase/topoisomerase IV subunit A
MSILEFTKDNIDTNDYPISHVAKNEWLSFAMYTVESRAIPNMIDGLKPVQRFYLYSSLLNSKRDFKKVSAVAGIISDYGYNHGEASAAGAGQLMAATWNNNVCLIEGRGSFGTRLVQEPGAPRYVYSRVHNNFEKYIKDMDLSPVHDDPEHEPPSYYLPVIPLVLANGTKGIATGFATNILPRCPNDLSRCVREYLLSGTITKKLPVTFPEFSGSVTYDIENKRFIVNGTFERNSKTVLTITEVPYGYDRESYVKVLNKLEDDNDIVSYEDKCDKQGFRFEIKLKLASANAWTDERIIRKFKLTKPLSENLTVIDQHGKLREYDDERDLIKDFCEFRMSILQKRIELRLIEAAEQIRWLKVKMEFIQAILNDKIIFKDRKKKDVVNQII